MMHRITGYSIRPSTKLLARKTCLQSWRPPLSSTGHKQYHAAGVQDRAQYCSEAAAVAEDRASAIGTIRRNLIKFRKSDSLHDIECRVQTDMTDRHAHSNSNSNLFADIKEH